MTDPPPRVPASPARRGGEGAGEDDRDPLWAGLDRGWVMVAELVAGVFTWGGIGWLADRWLGTEPWLLVAGFAIGWATGIYLAWLRYSRDMDATEGTPRARE